MLALADHGTYVSSQATLDLMATDVSANYEWLLLGGDIAYGKPLHHRLSLSLARNCRLGSRAQLYLATLGALQRYNIAGPLAVTMLAFFLNPAGGCGVTVTRPVIFYSLWQRCDMDDVHEND